MLEIEQQFSEFLQLFSYYLCSRCEMGAPHHRSQPIPHGSGLHAHNGEILHLLNAQPPTAARLFAAFDAYLAVPVPVNIQAQLAQAYNSDISSRRIRYSVLENSVQYLLANTRRTWLKHGIEQPETAEYDPAESFPPLHTRSHVGSMGTVARSQNWFAVDLDSWPFVTCSAHSLDQTAPWGYISGYLPLSRFRGQLHQPQDRDHYYANGEISTAQWLFLYRDIPSNEQALHRNLYLIKTHNLMHLHMHTVQRLHTVINKLENVAAVKNHMSR